MTDPAAALLARLAVRETVEDYLHHLDDRDWDGVASCFTADAVSHYNGEPEALRGGRAVADWLRERLRACGGSQHGLANLRITVDGDAARCDSRVVATLQWADTDRVSSRWLRYRDELVNVHDRWLIRRRVHEPLWQVDAPTVAAELRAASSTTQLRGWDSNPQPSP